VQGSAFAPLMPQGADVRLDDDELDAADAIDDELFPIFEEEADELLPQLQARLREWLDHPGSQDAPAACMRTLHTFKGGARLAGAMRLGEMAHRLEAGIEALMAPLSHGGVHAHAAEIEPLLARADAMVSAYEILRAGPAADGVDLALDAGASQVLPAAAVAVAAELAEAGEPPVPADAADAAASGADQAGAASLSAPAWPSAATRGEVLPVAGIDWARFAVTDPTAAVPAQASERPLAAGSAMVRVRGALLDRLVNQAGEVSITRARIDGDVKGLQVSLNELTDSLDRMRRQLRDIELQAETQMASRIEAAKAAAAAFDPLEMDRFTRFQELTRFMAESVNDVATLQRSLQRTLQSTEDQLAAQARLTRELQDDLLRTRMVEFDSMADRLYRTVRQAAKDTGKQVRLDISGGAIEIDRGVLERMAGPFEHLLRNSVAHGVESPDAREAAGKDRTGTISVRITQEGNEVGVTVHDDGAGLNLARIRERGLERGLIGADEQPADDELAQLIFAPGFSTAATVTELAGRGVGLDVVRAEVNAMGGRVQVNHRAGEGASFRLLLPLTTAVTQVVMLRCGDLQVAVPSTLVEAVRRERSAEVEAAYAQGQLTVAGEALPFFWLAALLQGPLRGGTEGRSQAVVLIRSADQRVALHVDEVLGNQEVVVKNVGPQLARLPGLAGVTLLPSGAVALIYNPVALATLYGPVLAPRVAALATQPASAVAEALPTVHKAPLVLVVDDSLTVRRVTQRLLVREGYRVTTAKDGMDALERLVEERPSVMLSDIEMPRMDGFDLARNVRADERFAQLPIIMITSRIAQKHREYAASLGVDHYLGKPYSEEELLALIARYVEAEARI
jgi:chemosensory pili system protein ChpA (sensor histidine kinase/response regulator)